MKITKSISLPKYSEIGHFEEVFCLELPKDFKKFLRAFNAIYLEESIYTTKEEKYYIDRFYPFGENIELSIQNVYDNLNGYFQNQYIAFANDPGDWQYVISLLVDTYGQIYLCRMDDILPYSLTYMANSFGEFINGLKREDEI